MAAFAAIVVLFGEILTLNGIAREGVLTRLLSGRFKDSKITLLQEVRFLRPDVAIVHWT